MKSARYLILLVIAFALFITPNLNAQDTLYYENFESGGGSFTRNTSDLGGSTNHNQWWINNSYNGGTYSVICQSVVYPFSVGNTPPQPAAIFNSPNSMYLHTLSVPGLGNFISNSNFLPADSVCNFGESNFAKMTSPVSTIGDTNVTLSFWWHCGGGQNVWGEVYYSLDTGITWVQITTPIAQYKNQLSWTQQTISLPAWNNQPNLQFAFRFANNITPTAQDPGYSIDDILITGDTTAVAAAIATDPILNNGFCAGDSVDVPYTVTGTFQPGNTFTAELSDGLGSFASPTILGSVNSTTSGTISGTIPNLPANGAAFRIRVTSSNPSVTGSDNGSDIYMAAQPLVGLASALADTLCSGDQTTINLSGSSGNISWRYSLDSLATSTFITTGPTSLVTNPMYASHQNFYIIEAESHPCPPDAQNIPFVVDSVLAGFSTTQTGPNDYTFTDNSFNALTWAWDFGDGTTASIQNPPQHSYANGGIYPVTLTVTSPFGCQHTFVDTVDIPLGIAEPQPPKRFEVLPNPVSNQAHIYLNLEEAIPAKVSVLDLSGREVTVLHRGMAEAGESTWQWHPAPELASGLYFVELKAGDLVLREKVFLLRE